MSNLLLPIASGGVALAAALVAGYIMWHARIKSTSDSDTLGGAGPLVVGLLAGVLVLVATVSQFIDLDRFYTSSSAISAISGTVIAALVILGIPMLCNSKDSLNRRLTISFLAILLASFIVTSFGIRFTILDLPLLGVITLGQWAICVTVIWLMFTVGVVKLLDGLYGAASVVLIVAGGAGVLAHIAYHEYFLTGLSLVFCGAALGALRFNMSAERLPLRGVGTLLVGFLFGVLTVLARQKSVALILLLSPIAVILVLAAGAMLTFLERSLLPARHIPPPPDEHSDE